MVSVFTGFITQPCIQLRLVFGTGVGCKGKNTLSLCIGFKGKDVFVVEGISIFHDKGFSVA